MPTPWGVQSLGYPNPLADHASGNSEWAKLERLVEYQSYQDARDSLTPAGQKSTMVETQKAALESFGILWVREDDQIVVTPGGRQYIDAVTANDEEEAGWVGLNLLLRCPLAGPRRNWRRRVHEDSDLPVYWALAATMLDLNDRLYLTELHRILCTIETRASLPHAIQRIRELRNGSLALASLPSPPDPLHAAGGGATDLYNRLNAALLHVGLARLLTKQDRDDLYLPQGGSNRFDYILSGWQKDMVVAAMGGGGTCGPTTRWANRVPKAIDTVDVEERFALLGAPVPDRPSPTGFLVRSTLTEDSAWLVNPGLVTIDGLTVRGPVAVLCVVAPEERVVLRTSMDTTFKVSDKQMSGDSVVLTLRQARRITDPVIVEQAFRDAYDD